MHWPNDQRKHQCQFAFQPNQIQVFASLCSRYAKRRLNILGRSWFAHSLSLFLTARCSSHGPGQRVRALECKIPSLPCMQGERGRKRFLQSCGQDMQVQQQHRQTDRRWSRSLDALLQTRIPRFVCVRARRLSEKCNTQRERDDARKRMGKGSERPSDIPEDAFFLTSFGSACMCLLLTGSSRRISTDANNSWWAKVHFNDRGIAQYLCTLYVHASIFVQCNLSIESFKHVTLEVDSVAGEVRNEVTPCLKRVLYQCS